MRESLVVFSAVLVLAAPSALGGAAVATDPDGGNARAYFKGLKPRPLSFARSGKSGGNVVWIVVDAMRPDHLNPYGYPKPTSPFMGELAEDSFVFLHAYVNAPWTRPSTASMLTGLYPSGHRTQTDKSRLPDEVRTVAQDMKARGYRTAAVVANGNGSSIAGLDKGFDHYLDPASTFKKLPDAADVYREALGWLESREKKDKPFFLFLFLVDPHDPYHAPPEYEKQWLGPDFEGEPRRRAHWEYKNNYPEAERRSMIAVYDAAIRYTDDQTRLFFGALDKLGLSENTTFVISADHGDGFGEHGYYLHAHHLYDEIIRVPLIIKSPAWTGSGQALHLVQQVDLLPTLMTLVGGKVRGGLSGRDIGELLAAPVDPTRRVLSEYSAFGIRRSAVLDLRYRVILQLPADKEEFLAHIPRTELLPSVSFEQEVVHVYDRRADPLERKNLAATELPAAAREMVESLREHMQASPASHEPTEGLLVPAGQRDNLRSLGYVQ